MKYLVFFLLFSCASEEKTIQQKSSAPDPIVWKTKCEEEGDALSCARYGYHSKDIAYTRQACFLGDQNSCFNLREIENRAPNQNFAIINSNQGQIFSCYVNHSIDFDNGEGEKKDKKIDLVFIINTLGKISSLSVQGEKISEKFKECVMNSFAAKKFVAAEHDQSIMYGLVMPAVTRDKRLEKRPKMLD